MASEWKPYSDTLEWWRWHSEDQAIGLREANAKLDAQTRELEALRELEKWTRVRRVMEVRYSTKPLDEILSSLDALREGHTTKDPR